MVAKKSIIAASLYKNNGKNVCKEGAPAAALELAEKIAQSEWQPDPMYIIDIAECNPHGLFLMEINSFSCSGLYHCDVRPVVEHASRLALAEWEAYNQQTTDS